MKRDALMLKISLAHANTQLDGMTTLRKSYGCMVVMDTVMILLLVRIELIDINFEREKYLRYPDCTFRDLFKRLVEI